MDNNKENNKNLLNISRRRDTRIYNSLDLPSPAEIEYNYSNTEEIVPSSQPNIYNNTEDTHLLPIVEDVTEIFDETDSDSGNTVLEDNEEQLAKQHLKVVIEESRKFYTVNYNYQILLKHESYVRYSNVDNFNVGYKYDNICSKMDFIQLLTQYVNEAIQIRYVCRRLYFIECSLNQQNSIKEKEFLNKYISKNESTLNKFKQQIVQEKREYLWYLKVYKDRYLYIKNKLSTLNILDGYYLEWRKIKDYDDVYKFLWNELKPYILTHFKNK